MWLEFVYILFFLSLTRGSTTKTSPSNVPTVTVPIRTLPRCRSTCLHMPSKTPRRTAAACAAGRTPQWVQTPSTIFKIWTNCCSDVLKCCFSLVFVFFQETYLIKHMSKHTMVEHMVSHHSPQHRTESPTIPIRISLIWVLLPSHQRRFLWHLRSSDGLWAH